MLVKRTNEVKGGVVVVKWKPCTASLFTIYHREVFSENKKSHWNGINVSGHETRYDLNLSCSKEYEIAITAWDFTEETPLSALNHNNMWRVTTLRGNIMKVVSMLYMETNYQNTVTYTGVRIYSNKRRAAQMRRLIEGGAEL